MHCWTHWIGTWYVLSHFHGAIFNHGISDEIRKNLYFLWNQASFLFIFFFLISLNLLYEGKYCANWEKWPKLFSLCFLRYFRYFTFSLISQNPCIITLRLNISEHYLVPCSPCSRFFFPIFLPKLKKNSQILTLDSWGVIGRSILNLNGMISALYLAVFVFIMTYFFLNILIGFIVDNMAQSVKQSYFLIKFHNFHNLGWC